MPEIANGGPGRAEDWILADERTPAVTVTANTPAPSPTTTEILFRPAEAALSLSPVPAPALRPSRSGRPTGCSANPSGPIALPILSSRRTPVQSSPFVRL